VITTKGGRPVVIPNAILFTSPVAVESTAAKTLSNFSVAAWCREVRNLAEEAEANCC